MKYFVIALLLLVSCLNAQVKPETYDSTAIARIKDEGKGEPIAEPKHTIEKAEDLACFPDGKRPAAFLFPPTFAARAARQLLSPFADRKLDHKEAWESKAVLMRAGLEETLAIPKAAKVKGQFGKPQVKDGITNTPLTLTPENTRRRWPWSYTCR